MLLKHLPVIYNFIRKVTQRRHLVEIKCPKSIANMSPEEAIDNKKLSYMQLKNGLPTLKRSHKYYYQIQGQLAITDRQLCYFIVWTSHGLLVEKVFPPEATQGEVFEKLSQLVQSALDGYHVCVFAYGQTGSGKTYTMQGEKDEDKAGIIPRAIKFIFERIANQQKVGWSYKVEASFLEIYNDTVHDLLDRKTNKQLEIRFNVLDISRDCWM